MRKNSVFMMVLLSAAMLLFGCGGTNKKIDEQHIAEYLEQGQQYYSEGKYEKAVAVLTTISENEEAKKIISESQKELTYAKAVFCMKNNDLESAIELLAGLGNFKNASSLYDVCLENIIYIGTWEASGDCEMYRGAQFLTHGFGESVDLVIKISEDGKTEYFANGVKASFEQGILKWNADDYKWCMYLQLQELERTKIGDEDFWMTNELEKPTKYASYAYTGTATDDQTKALQVAKGYLNVMAFSRKGLIEQLIYEGISEDDANYAADNCHVDWNEQALTTAKQYQSIFDFSAYDMLHQLEHDGYTQDQAKYACEKLQLE